MDRLVVFYLYSVLFGFEMCLQKEMRAILM